LSVPLKQVAKKGGGATEFNHPWKMSIITDEYDEQKLMIEDARIEIDGGHPDRVYFENMEYDLPDEADEYYVIGYAVYDPDAADGETSINHTCGVFYMNSDTTTADISNTYGFHTFLIGTLIVEDAGGESSSSGDLIYSIGEQYLTSCLIIFDEVSSAQFGCHLFMTSYPQDGSVVETFLGTRVAVNGGQLFIEDTGVSISDVE